MPTWISKRISNISNISKLAPLLKAVAMHGKPVLFVLGFFPLARWVWLGWHDQLTANPIEFLSRSSGTWVLVCLLVTLTITPLRQITGQSAFIRWRRMCGLFTFFYAVLHALTWAWWDQGFLLSAMLQDVIQRPFIAVGFFAFVGLTLLAATSTHRAMRALGRQWQRLHRLIYIIAFAAIVHYWWHKAGKNDFTTVSIYAVITFFLLAWRLQRWRLRQIETKTKLADHS
jgi:methionine sulfoxide reductase heme-binding subunit